MSDPIVDIIAKNRDKNAPADMLDVRTAKQIRQQIGQELLERIPPDDEFTANEIREVCQMEAQSDE